VGLLVSFLFVASGFRSDRCGCVRVLAIGCRRFPNCLHVIFSSRRWPLQLLCEYMFHPKQYGCFESRLADSPTRQLQQFVLGLRLPRSIVSRITKLVRTEEQMEQNVVFRCVCVLGLHASHVGLVLLESGLPGSSVHDTATRVPYLHNPK
jgi:hypothetical protein